MSKRLDTLLSINAYGRQGNDGLDQIAAKLKPGELRSMLSAIKGEVDEQMREYEEAFLKFQAWARVDENRKANGNPRNRVAPELNAKDVLAVIERVGVRG